MYKYPLLTKLQRMALSNLISTPRFQQVKNITTSYSVVKAPQKLIPSLSNSKFNDSSTSGDNTTESSKKNHQKKNPLLSLLPPGKEDNLRDALFVSGKFRAVYYDEPIKKDSSKSNVILPRRPFYWEKFGRKRYFNELTCPILRVPEKKIWKASIVTDPPIVLSEAEHQADLARRCIPKIIKPKEKGNE